MIFFDVTTGGRGCVWMCVVTAENALFVLHEEGQVELPVLPCSLSQSVVLSWVLQLPTTFEGNKYAVVFLDYLTKWAEVFAVPAQTVARLFVEEIV